jgi:transcription antitermination factor NusG
MADVTPHSEAPRWHVLQTLARQEKALAKDLVGLGIDHYLPLQPSVRIYGRRKMQFEVPLFSGYLFLRGTLDQAYQADRTRRVARILPVIDQSQIDAELAQIRTALDVGGAFSPYRGMEKGTIVQVRSGPFCGIVGEVEDPTRPDRLILRIRTLGQAVALEIDAGLLERLSPSEYRIAA